jgi:hypothetical protein
LPKIAGAPLQPVYKDEPRREGVKYNEKQVKKKKGNVKVPPVKAGINRMDRIDRMKKKG